MFVSSNCNIDKISSSGERYPLICAKNTNNLFWKEALLALQDFISISLKNERSLGNIPLLYNSKICIENRPIHFKSFFENGILFLSDLIDQSGNFLSFAEFKSLYDTNLCFITYHGIIQAVRKGYPSISNNDIVKISPNITKPIYMLIKDKKGSKSIYDTFISEFSFERKYMEKWETELGLENFNWQKCNENIFLANKDTYLQWLQYRIVHRILGTNKSLYMMNIKNNSLCTFCKQCEESIKHLFYDCNKVTPVLAHLENWLNTIQNTYTISLSEKDVILGNYDKNKHALNTIILLYKKYIYQRKLNEDVPIFDQLKKQIEYYIQIERNICLKNDNMSKFYKKWECFDNMINAANN